MHDMTGFELLPPSTRVGSTPDAVRRLLVGGCLLAGFGKAAAAAFPSRPVTLVVPFAAGTLVDRLTREVSERLAIRWRVPVTVDNRPGYFGWIGAQFAARARADGYTLLVMNGATLSPIFFKRPSLDVLQAFVPICSMYRGRHLIFGSTSLPPRLDSALEAARAGAGAMSYGYASSNTRLVMENLKRLARADIRPVPYKSVSDIARSLLQGDVQWVIDASATYRSLVEQGRVRAYCVVGSTRDPLLPDVPTTQELGIALQSPGFSGGLWAPAGTPASVVGQVQAAVTEVLAQQEVRRAYEAAGTTVAPSTSAAFLDAVHGERVYWSKAANASGFEPE